MEKHSTSLILLLLGGFLPTINSTPITNGQLAKQGQFPFYVSMLCRAKDKPGAKNCGASLLNGQWALTAAHCVEDVNQIALGIDSIKLDLCGKDKSVTRCQAYKWHIHPRYNNPNWLNNDIALIYIPNLPAKYNDPKYFVKLPPLADAIKSYAGEKAWIMGHGRTENAQFSDPLKYVEAKVVHNKDCERKFAAGGVTEQTVCALGAGGAKENACKGDSGGPLVIRKGNQWVQIGILSFTKLDDCVSQESGYTKVASYLHWIKQVTGINFD